MSKSGAVKMIAWLLLIVSTAGLVLYLIANALIWLFVAAVICCIFSKIIGGISAAVLSIFFISWFFIGLADQPFDYVAALYILALSAFLTGGALFAVGGFKKWKMRRVVV
ncbi:hypothetical protein ACFLVR_01380 [Chloroflexota bacterium]